MWSSACVFCIILVLCSAADDDEPRKIKLANGIEMSHISRAALLKILTDFEEQLQSRIAWKKGSPVFTVQFANNEYTKKFIYPDMTKRSLPSLNKLE